MSFCSFLRCWHTSPCEIHDGSTKGGEVLPFTEPSLREFLSQNAALSAQLGGSPSEWKITEVGDGNLNFVFIVHGLSSSVCVKQSVPYIRKFPMFRLAQGRIGFEYKFLQKQYSCVPLHVPRPIDFFPDQNCFVMEYLSLHRILRGEMLCRKEFPRLAEHLAEYLSQSLFFTSDFGLSGPDKRMLHQEFASNHPMCKITEEVIFTSPYEAVGASFPNDCPEALKEAHAAIMADVQLKLRVCQLKHQFLSSAEALIHADLHTGSVMVSETETRVIDGEFAFAGPMGFDVGQLLGNFFMNYISQPPTEEGQAYQKYVLHTIEAMWTLFKTKWKQLWDQRSETKQPGDVFPPSILSADQCIDSFFSCLLQDSLGFAACEMIRRTVGVAHVEDVQSIEDPQRKTLVQYAIVRFARWLLCDRPSMGEVLFRLPLAVATAQLCPEIRALTEVAALVLVAKFPIAGSSKTRLAKDLGPDQASEFSMVCLKDLLHRFNEFHDAHGYTNKVLLYAPPEAHQKFADMLAEEKLNNWGLQSMIQGDLRASDLGTKLTQARALLLQQGYGPVIFIGSDCPDLPFTSVEAALVACRGSDTGIPRAYITPVEDGGYALLGVPSAAGPETFNAIEWSTSRTCVYQIRQLAAQQFQVDVGSFLNDVDDVSDMKLLQQRRPTQPEIACPRVDAFLAALPPWP